MEQNFGRRRQSEVYVSGMSGQRPVVPVEFAALQEAARERMSPEAFAYIAGGAGQETTMSENREAFERWRIVPRVLRDVEDRDASVSLFGSQFASPFLLAPIGVLEMAHKDADLAVARAAGEEGIPMIFSNQASRPMEECAEVMGSGPRWFQLYWSRSRDLVASLVSRAEACGCDAIVITLDTTLLGWRVRDLDLAYLPFMRGKGIAQYTSDPVFMRLLEERVEDSEMDQDRKVNLTTLKNLYQMLDHYPAPIIEGLKSGKALAAVRQFINIYSNPALTWDDLAFVREHTSLPILLKGVLHPADAKRAVDEGIDGIVVSNHGGRQVDGSIATLDALPDIVDAVDDQIPILLDSGIRGGADIFKALALGAKAVLLGRPFCYGLAAGGYEGVREVLRNYKADFDLTMGLAGCRDVSEITRESLKKR